MKIVKDDPERVVWIDFDRAMIFDEQTITDDQKWWLEEEEIMVSEFHEALVSWGETCHFLFISTID